MIDPETASPSQPEALIHRLLTGLFARSRGSSKGDPRVSLHGAASEGGSRARWAGSGVLTLSFILAGCSTHLARPEHDISLRAPDKVIRGEEFHFTLTVKNRSGEEIRDVIFHWWITWPGLEGIHHKGKSGVLQYIQVKGAPGTGVLHILGNDEEGHENELVIKPFLVE
jgi:hypothetical protein